MRKADLTVSIKWREYIEAKILSPDEVLELTYHAGGVTPKAKLIMMF
jgi:hypothetical protein